MTQPERKSIDEMNLIALQNACSETLDGGVPTTIEQRQAWGVIALALAQTRIANIQAEDLRVRLELAKAQEDLALRSIAGRVRGPNQ